MPTLAFKAMHLHVHVHVHVYMHVGGSAFPWTMIHVCLPEQGASYTYRSLREED